MKSVKLPTQVYLQFIQCMGNFELLDSYKEIGLLMEEIYDNTPTTMSSWWTKKGVYQWMCRQISKSDAKIIAHCWRIHVKKWLKENT